MIRVFLADDHPVVRRGLRTLIEARHDMTVVGEAGDGLKLLNAERKETWDVLVLDLSLPRVGGMEALRRLRAECPGLCVVILSMYPEAQYAPRLLAAGAAAYLSKDLPPEEVVRVVGQVARGAYRAPAREAAASEVPHARLSPREYQVFALLCEGKSVNEIAAELDLAATTVSNHLAKVKEKLGARSIVDILCYAQRAGLLLGSDPV